MGRQLLIRGWQATAWEAEAILQGRRLQARRPVRANSLQETPRDIHLWGYHRGSNRWHCSRPSLAEPIIPRYVAGSQVWLTESFRLTSLAEVTDADLRHGARELPDGRWLIYFHGESVESDWVGASSMPYEFSRLRLDVHTVEIRCLAEMTDEDWWLEADPGRNPLYPSWLCRSAKEARYWPWWVLRFTCDGGMPREP